MSSEVADSGVPEGYKRIKLGPREITLPVNWGIRPVGELFEIEKISFDPDEIEPGSEVMLYSMPAYDSNKEPVQTLASEIGSRKYRVPDDTILFPKLNIRKRRFWRVRHNHELPAICSTEYWPLLPQTSLELDFYHYYFDSYEFISNPKVTSASSTNSHKRVKQASFEKLRLPVPPLAEQRRIADILSTVDEQIQQTDKIINNSKELKRGLMQDLLRPHVNSTGIETKLGIIPDDWEIKSLQSCNLEFISGGTPSRSSDEFFGGDIPWLKTGEVQNSRVAEAEESLTELGLSGSSAKLVPEGSVLVAMYGATAGNVGLLQFEAATNQACCAIVSDDTNLDSTFLYYQLLFENQRLKSYAAGSGQQNLSKSLVQSFDVLLPPLKEQLRIASVLSQVDDKIVAERESKEKLQELKRGLMQDLLTGKVRVYPE